MLTSINNQTKTQARIQEFFREGTSNGEKLFFDWWKTSQPVSPPSVKIAQERNRTPHIPSGYVPDPHTIYIQLNNKIDAFYKINL